ncbi:hypothetical protein HN371_02070 [Candidatus Poribacteria bacterium]|jgi:hypothetical protein|nr:hypothetical protein [Candidatus Poribacteria bacterium]MBT5535614.1 hypothetical protein [Candidatus Poribacteria bacterium]MBT7805446.1 hypothetical protein [Candidatus Poribacteria bacterium]
MRFPALPRRLITASLLAALVAITHAADPVAGVDFVWVDLGEENEGLLLTQEEQGDGMTEPDDVGGLECRINPWPYAGPGHNHMYFRIDDAYLFATNTEAWIIMEYFDSADAQQIDCQYDSNGAGAVAGAFRGAGDGAFEAAKPTGSETWLTHTFHLEDGRFENRANASDFRLSSHGQGSIWINRVWVSLVEPPEDFDPELPFGVSRPVDAAGKAVTTWAALRDR